MTDDKPDPIVVRESDGTLWVYPGGNRAFGTHQELGSGWKLTFTGDITGDGVSDLLGVQRAIPG
jgi:hypothetical protein